MVHNHAPANARDTARVGPMCKSDTISLSNRIKLTNF